jgi:predicted acylesterase/phospholipase RssA
MQYDLVFEGGGVKGMIFPGALEELKADGILNDRLLGTSAGAITATLPAPGYTPQEMLEALNEQEDGKPVFAGFMSTPPPTDPDTLQNSAVSHLLHTIDFPFMPDFVENKLDDWILETLANRPRSRHVFSFVEYGGYFSAHKFLTWFKRKLDTGTFEDKPRGSCWKLGEIKL